MQNIHAINIGFQPNMLTVFVTLQADDELDLPYLAGFEWDKDESWTRLIVHLKRDAGPSGGSKKKNKKGEDA